MLTTAGSAAGGDFFSQSTFGGSFFSSSPSCPAKRIPTFEVVVPIPGIFDPLAQDFVTLFCQIQTRKESDGVKGVRGMYTSRLIVRDNLTGQLESFDIDSGRFKTNKDGIAEFDFDFPSEIFADGFESGDVSAWTHTSSDFNNKRPVDNGSLQCAKGTSRSD